MSDIRRTRREDYLAAIESICEETDSPRAATGLIAERIGVTKGTVSAVLKQLADDGLADLIPYEGAKLTEQGRRMSRRIVRRYRLLELFLSRTLAVGWDVVANDAWRLEPGASDELIEQIDSFLNRPDFDPHGDPIPRIDGTLPEQFTMSLADCAVGSSVIVRRVRNQSAETLRHLESIDVVVGATVIIAEMSPEAETVTLNTGSECHSVGYNVARQILVQQQELG